jgi:hypothetical protein
MPAPESTKFQVNYSLPNGTLVNIYAASVTELEAGLADLAMNALNIRATGVELTGSVPAPAPTVESVAASFNATPVAAPQGDGKMCKHGQMNFRTGTNDRGTWQAWMCGAPKSVPKSEQCDPIWVR